ncbi:hypothetical protein MAUB1S_03873 [Mycolicibacterium aubagnense]
MYAQREDDAASSAGAAAAESTATPPPHTAATPAHQHRRVTSFRSRRSTLSTGQQRTWTAAGLSWAKSPAPKTANPPR